MVDADVHGMVMTLWSIDEAPDVPEVVVVMALGDDIETLLPLARYANNEFKVVKERRRGKPVWKATSPIQFKKRNFLICFRFYAEKRSTAQQYRILIRFEQ